MTDDFGTQRVFAVDEYVFLSGLELSCHKQRLLVVFVESVNTGSGGSPIDVDKRFGKEHRFLFCANNLLRQMNNLLRQMQPAAILPPGGNTQRAVFVSAKTLV